MILDVPGGPLYHYCLDTEGGLRALRVPKAGRACQNAEEYLASEEDNPRPPNDTAGHRDVGECPGTPKVLGVLDPENLPRTPR